MRKALKIAFLTLIAAIILIPQSTTQAQKGKVIAIDLTPGRVKDIESKWSQMLLHWLEGNLTAMGWKVIELTEITPESLSGVDALVIGKLRDESGAFSGDELKAIQDWFFTGGKFLWVGADSDYTEPYLNPMDTSFKSKEPNKILAAVGAHLRLDHASLEDPECNAGAAYRVISNRSNTKGFAAQITKDAPNVLFHGPTFVVGYDYETLSFVILEKAIDKIGSDKLTWLYRSTDAGTVVSHDAVDPLAYPVGYMGSIPEAAAEKINVGGKYFSKIIVTSESLIGDRNVFNTAYHGFTLQGPTFVLQAFTWGLTPEEVPPVVKPIEITLPALPSPPSIIPVTATSLTFATTFEAVLTANSIYVYALMVVALIIGIAIAMLKK